MQMTMGAIQIHTLCLCNNNDMLGASGRVLALEDICRAVQRTGMMPQFDISEGTGEW